MAGNELSAQCFLFAKDQGDIVPMIFFRTHLDIFYHSIHRFKTVVYKMKIS